MQRLVTAIIALFICQCFTSYGQPLDAPTITGHLTIKNGLSNNFVTDIVQDNKGFLWVGTESGLNRFDGENFTTFSMKNSAIVGNAVQCLLYDEKHNKLWIGTKMGLSVLDCCSQKIEPINLCDSIKLDNVAGLSMAVDGGIWIANHYDNLIYYNPDIDSIAIYNSQNMPGLQWSFRCIEETADGTLYVGHENEGMGIVDRQTGKVSNFRHDPDDPHSIPGNDVSDISIDHYGNVWVGTNNGLALFDPVTEQFVTFYHDPSNPHSPIGNHVYEIHEMDDYTLWIAYDPGGVSILDLRNLTFKNPTQLQFVNLEAAFGDDNSISSPNVRAFLQDSYGNIWIGNYNSGLDFISHLPTAFRILPHTDSHIDSPEPIWSLYEDAEGVVWVGTLNKVISMKRGKIIRTFDLSQYISSALSHVTSIFEYKGNLIVGIYDGGALSIDTHSGAITRIIPPSLSYVYSLCETPDGKLLIGAKDGLFIYDGNEYSKLREVSSIFYNLTPNGIVYDNQGKLWIGTYGNGVYVFDENMKLVSHLDSHEGFVSNAIDQIIKDSTGMIWIAGQDGLACVEDTSMPMAYVNYGYEDGIDDIHIRAIVEDKNGDIWFAQNRGITRFNRKNQRFNNYDYNDGLPQSSFLDRAVTSTEVGDLYFGSFNGICAFNPDNFSTVEEIVPVQIVECQNIINYTDSLTDEIIMPRPDGRYVLPYDHSSFRVIFSVPDFSQSRLVEYSYMIKGIDADWIPTQGVHYATFRNLPPGNYTFMVRARLKNQDWDNASIAKVGITVNPPLWLTWWAKLIYVLLVVVAIYLSAKYYKRRLMLKNTLELERRKSIDEKALNDERLRFYTNITHELRTPLTLILGPLEDLVADDKMPKNYQNKIKIIHESASRLLNLINQILEFRKTETQNRKLTVGKGNICNLVMEIGLRYKELNRNENVKFNINLDSDIKDVYFDSEIITTVLNNLLSNAVKYTPEGEISLTLGEINENGSDYVEICVTDTGYGIEADALPHIFDRYYQVQGKHQASGTGIGLALVKSLCELHEAQLSVESEPKVGTAFRLLLLRDNTYPAALHKEIEPEKVIEKEPEPVVKEDGKPLVLVVEDDESIRDYIESSLAEKFRTLVAKNGKEGLEIAGKEIPDIIISDIMMPVMDGIELCRHIKENINTSHIPVVLLTAKDSLHDREEGYESGADSYLTKPFSAKLLISRINNILESRKMLASFITSRMDGNSVISIEPQSAKVADAPLRLSKLDEDFLNRFTVTVEENLTNANLDMAFIQDALNMSHSTIYRKVKSLTGMSGNEFIRKIRLKHGHEALEQGCNVAEAACSSGFGDVKHFRNSFKEAYGITPSQFIKDLKSS